MALPTYNSASVNAAWSGVNFEGFAPDSFITFARNGDITDEEMGADKKLSISILPDDSGTCTIQLQKNSPSNIALSALLKKQKKNGGIFVADMSVVDPSGGAIARLQKAHIKTAPEIVFSSSATGTAMSWTFYVEDMDFLDLPEGILASNPNLAAIASAADTAADFFNSVF